MDEREEGFYFHTICDFVQLIEIYGIERVAKDFKATSPVIYEQLQKVVLIERDRSKTAALLQYNEAVAKDSYFGEYNVDTNNS